MKKAFIPSWLLSLLCIVSQQSFAIKPVSGLYGGVFLGPTYTPSISFNFNPSAIPKSTINTFESSLASFFNLTLAEVQTLFSSVTLPNKNIPGTLKYSVLGGLGGELGYRICGDYRLETEIFYNNNHFSKLTIGDYYLESSNSGSNPHISGDTNTTAVLVNFLYDIPIPSKDGYAAIRPYLGAGAGYSYIFSDLTFHYGANTAEQADGGEATTLYQTNLRKNKSALAVQGIIGVGYFLDDFCWLSLDGRYFTTPIKTNVLLSISGINFQSKTELYSVMIGFHGVFSHD